MKRAEFEGNEVVAIDCKMVGSVGDGRLNGSLSPGERIVIVAEGVVRGVNHVDRDEGVVRVQTIRVAEGFVLSDVFDANDLIHKLRAERKAQLDELLGTPPLEGME